MSQLLDSCEPCEIAKAVDTLSQMECLIKERGWTQNNLEDPETGAVCLLGAEYIVLYGKAPFDLFTEGRQVEDRVERALRKVTGVLWLAMWNDSGERTERDVLKAIRKARRTLKKELRKL